MCTIVQFRILVLDSLKYNSKWKSPINRSFKAVISRVLTTSRHNHLFIFLSIFFFFFFKFIFHKFSENRHYRLICIAIATDVIGWSEWIKKYVFIIYEINNSCLLWQTLSKPAWYLLKNLKIKLLTFLLDTPAWSIGQKVV